MLDSVERQTYLRTIAAATSLNAILSAWRVWQSRSTAPFELSEGRDGRAYLRRTRHPRVQLLDISVPGHGELFPLDASGTCEFRIMSSEFPPLALLVDEVPPGQAVVVRYRRLWLWDLERNQTRLNNSQELRSKRDARRERLRSNSDQWTCWTGILR